MFPAGEEMAAEMEVGTAVAMAAETGVVMEVGMGMPMGCMTILITGIIIMDMGLPGISLRIIIVSLLMTGWT
jgi:hypothetical protein